MSERQRPEDAASYITVSDPVQHQDGMNKYTSYRVDVRGGPSESSTEQPSPHNSSMFQNPGYSAVLRRYSDFLWLFQRLHAERGGAIVPPLPEKQPVGRFSAAFIEDRRKNLERFLRRVATHPELQDASCVNTFLRADDATFNAAKHSNWEAANTTEHSNNPNIPNNNTMASQHSAMPYPPKKKEGIKLPSWLKNTATSVTSSLTGAPDLVRSPDDDLFDEIERYIHGLDDQMKSVAQQASGLVRKGKDIANGMFEFGLAFSLLGQSEAEGLGTALQKMGDAADSLSVMTAEHAEREANDFEDPLQDYIRMIHAVKLALQKRNERRRAYSNSLADVSNKQIAASKVKGVITKEEKSYIADMSLMRAQEESEAAREEFAAVSQRLLREVDRFKRDKADDMRRTVMDYINLQIDYNRKMEDVWANLIPQLEQVQLESNSGGIESNTATVGTNNAGGGGPYM